MKRLFCFIMSLCIVVFPVVIASAMPEDNTLELGYAFLEQLDKMIRKYDSRSVDSLKSNSTNVDNSMDQGVTIASRLIIKTRNNNPIGNDHQAIDKVEGYAGLHVLQYDCYESAEGAFEYYSANYDAHDIEYIEFDKLFTLEYNEKLEMNVQSYDFFTDWNCWGVDTVLSEKALSEIDNSTIDLSETMVAVLDSGLNTNHASIDKGRVTGIVDGEDVFGHGTKVTSIIQRNTPDSVIVYPVTVIDENGEGGNSIIITTILFLADSKISSDSSQIKVDIMNISINANTITNSKAFEDAINNAVSAGITVVVSSGNNYSQSFLHPPANVNNAIVVAGSIEGNTPFSPSNRGKYVDLAAPGQNILCAMSKSEWNGADEQYNNYLVKASGTSFAAPFVSAAAAILKSIDTPISPQEIETVLKTTVTPWNGIYPSYGTGIVNFVNMLNPYRIESPIIQVNWESNEITLTAPATNPLAELYYTLDGSEPTKENAIRYTGPFTVERQTECVKAAAYVSGRLPSQTITSALRFTAQKWELRYKASETLRLPDPSMHVLEWRSSDRDVVSVDSSGKITAHKRGEAVITARIAQNRYIEYEISVDYAWWQWLIIVVLFGWIWYI